MMTRKKILWFLTDTIIFVISFYILIWIKYGYLNLSGGTILTSIYIFIIWMVISAFTKKQAITEKVRSNEVISDIAISNVFILLAILLLIHIRPRFTEIRFLLIYLVVLISLLEFLAGWLFAWYNRIKTKPFDADPEEGPGDIKQRHLENLPPELQQAREALERILMEEPDEQVVQFVGKYLKSGLNDTYILSTSTRFNIVNLPHSDYENLINLKPLNEVKDLDRFLEAVNSKLRPGGTFLASIETDDLRKKSISENYPLGLNYLVRLFDSLAGRFFPTDEALELIFSRNFRIMEKTLIGGRMFFVASKNSSRDILS